MKMSVKYFMLMVILAGMAFPQLALSTTYSFSSATSSDLYDLDHNYLYLWGINADQVQMQGQRVVSATIQINNIRDWVDETDILRFYLLDNVRLYGDTVDIIRIYDGSSVNNQIPNYQGTRFTGNTFINSWSDPDGDGAVSYNLEFTFNAAQLAALNDYLLSSNPWGLNSTFGLGFDPDCHYFNNGITLNIETAPVPEPGTLLLLGSGLVGMFSFGRRRMKG